MANVLVPNIFITTNYDYIRSYFVNRDYKAGIDGLPAEKDVFLISSKTNKYLESFEHSFNYDSSDQSKLVLKFIDVDGKFEDKFFIRPINLFRTKLEQELKKDRQLNLIDGARNIQSERNVQGIYDEVASLDTIYVSYGIGNDTRNWSDPMTFQLFKSEVEVNEAGLRKYILTFNISNNVLFKPKLILNLNAPNPAPEFNFANHVDSAKVYLKQEYNQTHESIVYQLIKKYISLISTIDEGNLIVILPKFEEKIPQSWTNNYFQKSIIFEKKITLKDYFDIDTTKADTLISQYRDARPSNLRPNTTAKNESVNATLIQLAKENKQYFYVMSSKPLPKNPLHPTLPDWYAPLNKISEALKSLLNSTDDLIVIEESNVKLLNLWHEFGLINDPTKRCVIVGGDRLINDWLYRNHTSLPKRITLTLEKTDDEWIKLLDAGFSPAFKLIPGKEKDILEKRSSEYYLKYMLTTSKRKNGSNFDEEVILDELVPVLKKYNKEVLPIVTCTNLLKLLDIPIFTNNLKNSNILSLSVDNSQTYLDMLRIAVRNDYDKFFLASVASDADVVNINGHKPQEYIRELKRLINGANGKGMDVPGTAIAAQQLGLVVTKELLSAQFRQDLRNVLIQQYYFLEQAGHDVNTMDANKLQQALENAQASPIETGETIVVTRDSLVNRDFFVTRDLKVKVLENSDQTKERIQKDLNKLGVPKVYTQEEVKRILSNADNLIKTFDKIIVQRKGDADIGNLLLGVAVSRVEGIVPEGLEEQSRILNSVMLLSYMYNTSFLKSDIPESKYLTITPKQFSIPQTALLGELMKFASRQMYKISLKTLPFFHLSNFRQMNLKPCFLFSRKMYAIKSNRDQSLIDYDFFNGAYNITGFKHTITTKDAYSQFLLQKITTAASDT